MNTLVMTCDYERHALGLFRPLNSPSQEKGSCLISGVTELVPSQVQQSRDSGNSGSYTHSVPSDTCHWTRRPDSSIYQEDNNRHAHAHESSHEIRHVYPP